MPASLNAAAVEPVSIDLPGRVGAQLAAQLRLPCDKVHVPNNVVKYSDGEGGYTSLLEEVFELMWSLNKRGVSDATLCADRNGHGSFSAALNATIEDIVRQVGTGPIQYTELGPEPCKTSYILKGLSDRGLDVLAYHAVDINPESEQTMREHVGQLLPAERIHYHNALFEEVGNSFLTDGCVNLVTMLGFEEGNEHPDNITYMMDNILRECDLFLTEVQVLSTHGWGSVFGFYENDLMRRFSEACLERHWPAVSGTEYGVYLVPIDLDLTAGSPMAAVAAETDPRTGEIFVTNYCLKWAAAAYRENREQHGRFKVVAERSTGDKSVVFQVSEKTAF